MSKREGLSILTNIRAIDKLKFIVKSIGAKQPPTEDYILYHIEILVKLGVDKSNIVANITKMTKTEGGKITLVNLININGGGVLFGKNFQKKKKQK